MKTISGTLRSWEETGLEGTFASVVTLDPQCIKDNPQTFEGEESCDFVITYSTQFSVYDKTGKLIWEKGQYKSKGFWPKPEKLGPANILPNGVEEAHWAHWVANNFRVTIYLD
jgi:hypothetical protein